jgi:hypothetical protein
LHQLPGVATRQIAPADSAIEQYVAIKQCLGGRFVKANVTGCVTGGVEHLKVQRSNLEDLAFGQFPVWLWCWLDLKTPQGCKPVRIGQQGLAAGVYQERGIAQSFQGGRAGRVVKVGVG